MDPINIRIAVDEKLVQTVLLFVGYFGVAWATASGRNLVHRFRSWMEGTETPKPSNVARGLAGLLWPVTLPVWATTAVLWTVGKASVFKGK